MKTSVLELVEKFLKRAANNPYESEAQACMLKAQRLMAENGLSMEDVGIKEQVKEVVTLDAGKRGRTIWWKKELAGVIAENFRCKCVITRYQDHNDWRKSSTVLRFIGLKEDAELAVHVFNFAVDAINFNSREYVRKSNHYGMTPNQVKESYIKGFLWGLIKQFKEQVESNNWGLVLVTDPVVQKYYDSKNIGKQEWRPSGKNADHDGAISKGYKDGKSFKSAAGRVEEAEGDAENG